MPRRYTHGFTLIELLAVLLIAGVLIGLTIPAVTSLMSSGGVAAGSREVADMLGYARQIAVMQHAYARVVFPYAATGSQPGMQYRAYAVMTNRDNASTTWAYASKWEYLPMGSMFIDKAHSPGATPNGALDDTSSLNPQPTEAADMLFPTPAGGLVKMAYIEFGPTGAATAVPPNTTASSTLALTEGFTVTNSTTATPTPTASRTITNSLANLTVISVDPLVGQVQVAR